MSWWETRGINSTRRRKGRKRMRLKTTKSRRNNVLLLRI
jgi:hypothetical protein